SAFWCWKACPTLMGRRADRRCVEEGGEGRSGRPSSVGCRSVCRECWLRPSVKAGADGDAVRRLHAVIRCCVFDVGETLVRDDRYWGLWADWLKVPRHTLSALVGAVVALGRDNADAL